MRAWTDYPFEELGDNPGVKAPVREVDILCWDENKYVKVKFNEAYESVKTGYIYQQQGRYGEVPNLTPEQLKEIPVA